MPLFCLVHLVPSQRRIVPAPPTTQALSLSTPHTSMSAFVVPVRCLRQALPSHLRIVPPPPTTQTLSASAPHTGEVVHCAAALRGPVAPVPVKERTAVTDGPDVLGIRPPHAG